MRSECTIEIKGKHIFFVSNILELRGACGVMVIVIGNGHSDPSSNPEWACLHFI